MSNINKLLEEYNASNNKEEREEIVYQLFLEIQDCPDDDFLKDLHETCKIDEVKNHIQNKLLIIE